MRKNIETSTVDTDMYSYMAEVGETVNVKCSQLAGYMESGILDTFALSKLSSLLVELFMM